MKKRSIFSTWSPIPTKNVKTPIRHFDGESEEDLENLNEPIVTSETETNLDDVYVALSQIKFALFILIVLKLICLIRK